MTSMRVNHPTKESAPAYTFGGKPPESLGWKGPGPGNYSIDIKLHTTTAKSGTLGKSTRPNMANTRTDPGPGAHFPELSTKFLQ